MYFRVETPKHCIFDFIVHFFSEFPYFRIRTSYQLNDLLEDPCEVFVLQDQFSVSFQNVENRIACCRLHFGICVPERIYDRVNQALKKLCFFLNLIFFLHSSRTMQFLSNSDHITLLFCMRSMSGLESALCTSIYYV